MALFFQQYVEADITVLLATSIMDSLVELRSQLIHTSF